MTKIRDISYFPMIDYSLWNNWCRDAGILLADQCGELVKMQQPA